MIEGKNSEVFEPEDEDIAEEIPVELIQKETHITDVETEIYPELILQELEGNILNKNILKLNARGLENGLREKEDGIAFFGNNFKDENGNYVNDFILNIEDSSKLSNPHVFLIYFRRDLGKYFLENIEENKEKYFLFVHLEKPHVICGEKTLVSILNYHFKFSVDHNHDISVQYSQDNMIINKIVFKKEKGTIIVGRKVGCDIIVNTEGFSREQCIIYYDNSNNCWMIRDGKDKPSGSGTWLYIDHHYHIKHSIKFMLGQSLLNLTMKIKNEK